MGMLVPGSRQTGMNQGVNKISLCKFVLRMRLPIVLMTNMMCGGLLM
jgi:hypothetical protein